MRQGNDFSDADYQKYRSLTPEERGQTLQDARTPKALKALLLFERGQELANARSFEAAIALYDKALSLQPKAYQIWDCRGDALRELSRYEEAVVSYDTALKIKPDHYITWVRRGAILRHLGRESEAVASLEMAQKKAGQERWRRSLLDSTQRWLMILKYPVLLFGLLLVGAWVESLKLVASIAVSLLILWLMGRVLWLNQSRSSLITHVYLRSGILTYLRAVAVIVLTIAAGIVIASAVPEFMRVGWANLAFGGSINVIFQPFLTISELTASTQVGPVAQALPAQAAFELNATSVLTILFWLVLILVVPFWAEAEEKLFRQGVHTWRGMAVNSIKFGLIHLVMGIPTCWALTLAIPGFLFACRYRYAYHRHLGKFQNPAAAIEAGVLASTADHAVYNAILITILAVIMLLP